MLGGPLAAAYVRGCQAEGVAAVAKHFMLNQQETQRMTSSSDVSSDRVLMELYAPPFAAATAAGVAGMMCSYNLVNGEYACGSRLLQAPQPGLYQLRQL